MSEPVEAALVAPDHLSWGTYVEESATGYRVVFSDGNGKIESVEGWTLPGHPTRFFAVGPIVKTTTQGESDV